jgi:BolA protein
MDINELIAIVKKKLEEKINIESIRIEDKSFLHKNHAGNQEGKFHLKVYLESNELKKMSRIESNKKIYKILDEELKMSIHSIQILIS